LEGKQVLPSLEVGLQRVYLGPRSPQHLEPPLGPLVPHLQPLHLDQVWFTTANWNHV